MDAMIRSTLIEGRNVSKIYKSPDRTSSVLNGMDFSIREGEFVALVGRSGTGKTTLLNLIGGLDRPTSGELLFAGRHLESLSDKELSVFRNETVGFIFQSYFLRPLRTAVENVMVPLLFGKFDVKTARNRAVVALKEVGLESLAFAPVNRLSGGQKQRVAIARAVANNPKLILADEPTGNLDTTTAREIFALLKYYNEEHNTAVVIVTHDPLIDEFNMLKWTITEGKLASYDAPLLGR
jgi:ABC-type lipoprotein export system ATPase subunit